MNLPNSHHNTMHCNSGNSIRQYYWMGCFWTLQLIAKVIFISWI